jgi:succinate dehydrogenase / fumarate reductase, flavoprotein subunit
METLVPGLYACGEAVGGANGANRLSGNAITESFVFGARAGRNAALRALAGGKQAWTEAAAAPAIHLLASARKEDALNPAASIAALQVLMADKVGPFRTDAKLREALEGFDILTRASRLVVGMIPSCSTGWICATCSSLPVA